MSLPVWDWDQDPAPLRSLLDRSGILALPTESSYALGVDPASPTAVDALGRLKQREGDKPFGIVVSDLDQAEALGVDIDDPGVRRASQHWPAALNVIAPLRRPLAASGDSPTVALRIPDHPQLRRLLECIGPLTATSANRAGEPPILEVSRLSQLLAGIDAIVVGGRTLAGGPPSTLVRWRARDFQLLREGRFPFERLTVESN